MQCLCQTETASRSRDAIIRPVIDIYERVAGFIRHEHLLREGQRVVAAVSGGADSLCLLDCLRQLGYEVIGAHLDHQLREGSRQDAEYTLEVLRRYGLPGVIAREDVRSLALDGGSIEDIARQVRYRFLARVAREHRARVIATGHTADDQAETILMHLLRGAGPEGLRGMLPATTMGSWAVIPEAEGLTLVRPLLQITRGETQSHCLAIGLSPRQDPSNLDRVFLRNRVRHELLPLLETYSPGVRRILTRTGKVMAAQASLIGDLVESIWPEVIREAGAAALAIRVQPWLAQPEAIQAAVLRRAMGQIRPGLSDVGLEVVERGLEFIRRPPRARRMDLAGGLEMVHLRDEVILAEPGAVLSFPDLPQLVSERSRRLTLPGKLRLASGWRLEASVEAASASYRRRLKRAAGGYQVAIDAEVLRAPLSVRRWAPGDRIHPLGMEGTVKVADLFANEHVPLPARGRWPVVVAGDSLVWVVGLRMSHEVRLTSRSRQALVLRAISPKSR
jgi:tRNA(Ile)-lysidine synthetase-like protein